MAQGSARRRWALLAFGVMSLGGLAAAEAVLTPADRPVAAAERPAQPVRVTAIRFQSSERVASYTGTIRPRQEVGLGFRLAGKVTARPVEVGDRVRQGQLLAELDDTDTRLERDLAAAERAAAEVDLLRAEADAARSRTLFADGHLSQAALDRAISGAAEAAARADRAARALALADNRLGYTRLLAPSDGVVTATLAEPGQVVAAGQAVVSVAQEGALDVVFALPEQDRDLVGSATAQAALWGAENAPYALEFRDISPDADPAGRTYRVRMALVAPDAGAALGRTVTVTLTQGEGAAAAEVPLAAVLNDGTGATVWRLDATRTRVEPVPVTLVSVNGQVARLHGPLEDEDLVVSLGAHKLDPARPVRIVETYATPEG